MENNNRPPRKRHHRRSKSRPPQNNDGNSSPGNSSHRRSSNHPGRKRRSRGGGRNRRRHNRRPLTLEEQVLKRYHYLFDQHEEAKEKYFELYFRADPNQRRKLERRFYQTIEELRDFEYNLKEEERGILQKNLGNYQLDLTYTQNHDLRDEAPPVTEGPFEDPHVLPSQKARHTFKDDTEESTGTVEDFKKYKGLT